MHKLTYKKSALKALRKMPRPQAQKLQCELSVIAKDPYAYSGDWKPLKGEPYWRLRQGGYRAVCSIDDGELLVLVLKVGPRGDVYK
ncbi:type II toxin-antitoxin system RelE family toxin [Marinobacter sp. CA1]|uniref:type II toxin-antitoxin system RelE family toxin n=1 Tax=Marinobacter sp. CA1 TaxID=2817656 RepID=UPI001D0940DC|nr:type II toxin-antitoxin system RelE/ParE family toxin [Marinobacter sp. CA1]UDL04007.1 type II toxin-antitoxin system RelE/ParE family toxin [Marinobacter sp. CA1]